MKNKTIIIAEAGVNHNGQISLAMKMIDLASDAGADYIKFQTFKTELCISKAASKAEYQKTDNEETQFEMVKKLELSKEDHFKLIEHCKKKKINFLSTGFDITSLEFLNDLNMAFFKVPSGEITNLPYLEKVSSFKRPIVLSTGMSSMKEIEDAFQILISNGVLKKDITILHCNTEYPTPYHDVNLNAMITIKNKFGVNVGYSDHTLGIEIPIAAVAMGATIIEKHFTIDKNMDGPDHKASLEPSELKNMVYSIRNIENSLGNGIKECSKSEQKNKAVARKSIHIKKDLKKGAVLKKENLIMKRPGDGISPMKINDILGKETKKDLNCDHKLSLEDLL